VSGAAGAAGAPPASGTVFNPCAALGIASIRSLAYTPDGKGVVAGLAGGVAKLIDPSDGRELRSYFGHSGGVNDVAVSADGTLLATASDDATVRLFDVADGTTFRVLRGHDHALLSVAIAPDGSEIAAGASDGELLLWTRDGTLVTSAAVHTDEVRGLTFASGGTRVFSASKDGSLRVWSAVDLTPIAAPITGGSPLSIAVASPDGSEVAVGGFVYAVELWDAASATMKTSLATSWNLTSIDYAPSGDRVYVTLANNDVYSYQTDGSASHLLLAPIGSQALVVASPLGDDVFVATDWALWLTDPSGSSRRDPIQEGPFTRRVAFSADGSRLAVGGDFGFVLRDTSSYEVVAAPDVGQFAKPYNALAFSPDGKTIATGDDLGAVKLWSGSGFSTSTDVTSATVSVQDVAFSPDGSRLALAGREGMDDLWTLSPLEFVSSLGYSDDGYSVAFSADGSTLALGTGNYKLGIFQASDLSALRQIDSAHSVAVEDLAFTPDGALLASTGDERVTVWETRTNAERHDVLDLSAYMGKTVAISPDGTLLVAGGNDGELRRWTLPELTPLPVLAGHGPGAVKARFSPDGQKLAVGYDDGTTWIWCAE
jgi:WD40 repeat protein